MKDIPAQIHNIRKTTLGEVIITFRVDELYADTVSELFLKKIGTQFVMKLEDVSPDTVLGGNDMNDTTKEKFNRQLFATMRNYQERSGTEEKEVKIKLAKAMHKRGIDYTSRKELGIKELAIAISIVDSWINE